MENNIFDFIKKTLSKKDIFSIPYWDRVRMIQINFIPEDMEMSHLHLLKKKIDKNHYLLTQLAIVDGKFVKYEQVMATIHYYDFHDGCKGNYRTYKLLKEVWFY